jgi:hypothetical protein
MKRIYYLIVLLSLMSLSSCQKFLDTKPSDFLSPVNYYTTLEQLNFARSGVYNDLGGSMTSYTNYLTFAQADESFMNRTSLSTGPWNYFYNSADTYVLGVWTNLYDGINRANVLLANLDRNPDLPLKNRNIIRGEMLFLRGYFYFQLACYWGGVPIKTEPTTSIVNVDLPRASLKDTYAQILKDMEAAEPLVPRIDSIKYGGGVNKSAVRGLLARVNLYMAGAPLNDKTRYAQASKWAKMVMDDPLAAHTLNPSYPQIFINLAQDKYDIKESIWEVEYWGNNTTQWTEAGNNGYINGPASNTTWGQDAAYMTITSKFYDVFENGDNRKWWNIPGFNYGSKPTKTMVTHPVVQSVKNALYPGKWRREYETVTPQAATSTPINNVLLRYADILLIYAEAENEINTAPTLPAIKAINDVRERGWSTGVKSITVTSGGSGYTTAPTVTFSAGAGTNIIAPTAIGTATISGGAVTAINLSRDLTGVTYYAEGQYTTPPTITITGGGGTGAAATAIIWKKSDADLTASQTASKATLLAVIQDERMRELNSENLRKFDLLRWGIFLQVNQDLGNRMTIEGYAAAFVKYYTNVSERDLFWPIPSVEAVANRAIEQNPLW